MYLFIRVNVALRKQTMVADEDSLGKPYSNSRLSRKELRGLEYLRESLTDDSTSAGAQWSLKPLQYVLHGMQSFGVRCVAVPTWNAAHFSQFGPCTAD